MLLFKILENIYFLKYIYSFGSKLHLHIETYFLMNRMKSVISWKKRLSIGLGILNPLRIESEMTHFFRDTALEIIEQLTWDQNYYLVWRISNGPHVQEKLCLSSKSAYNPLNLLKNKMPINPSLFHFPISSSFTNVPEDEPIT